MFGHGGRNDIARQSVQFSEKRRSRFDMAPPSLAVTFAPVFQSLGEHVFLDVLKWNLEQCSLRLGHLPTKIDNPLISVTTGDVLSISPRMENCGVKLAIWIRG